MLVTALMAGSQILGGIGAGKQAGKIAKEQSKIAEINYEYNKKEIAEGFKRNLSGLMENYTEKRSVMIKEATSAASQLNAATANKTNVDNEFNSFRTDAANKLDSEFMSNLNNVIEEQAFAIGEMSRGRVAADLNNQNEYSNMLGNISSAKLQNEQQANNQILKGSLNMASGYIDYMGKKRKKEDVVQQGEESIFSSVGDKFQSLITGMGGLF